MSEKDLKKKNQINQLMRIKRDFVHHYSRISNAGGAVTVFSMIDTMNPAKDVVALSTTEVDLSPVEEGSELDCNVRGKPVFIRHRTSNEINDANDKFD